MLLRNVPEASLQHFRFVFFSLSNAGLRPAGDAVSSLREQNALLVGYDFSVTDACGRGYVHRFFDAQISAGTVKKQCWFEPAASKIVKNI